MASSRVAALVIVLCILSAFSAEAAPPGPMEAFRWVAYPEAGNPEFVNPAGFSFVKTLWMKVGAAFSDNDFEGFDRVSVGFPGAGIAGWWNDEQNMRRFDISSGIDLLQGAAALGVGYTWFDPTVRNSIYQDGSFYTFGVLVRPMPRISMGMVRRGAVDADSSGVEYAAGIAVRPLGENLTFTADLLSGEDFDNYDFSAGVEFRPMEGLTVRAEAGEDHFSAGLEAGLGFSSLSSTALADDQGSYTGSRAEVTLHSDPGPDLFAPSGYFVRFSTEDMDELRQRPFLGALKPCFTENVLMLQRIADDEDVAGVIVDIEGGGSPAQLEEIRNILQDMKSRGKKVYCYLQGGSSADYYLASCGSALWMHPAGRISFSGLSSQSFFLRDFLDDLGIYPDLQHIGRYKSASDMLTRSHMSDAHREATTHLLQSMQEELTAGVSAGRGLEPAALRTIMDSGPYSGTRAVEAGMVDGVCFSDQVEEEVEELLGRSVNAVDIQQYRNSLYNDDVWGMKESVAVVTATGYIETGSSGSSFPMGRVMGSETICRALREAASTPGVRAVVLRIDSPGGDALASADMHHAVQEVRESMPVVVSMGGVAASGGYYMACGADTIFADRLTVTGSIGIISGKFSFGEALDSLGINVEEITTGPMAAMQSPFRKYSDEERERAYLLMRDGYELFVETVAEGRGMTFQQVDSIGRGRVWTGSSALELGLVDRCGGVVDAVNCAAGLAGISEDGQPDVVIFPSPAFPGSLSIPGFGVSSQLIDLLGSEDVLYLMQPFRVH